MKFNRVFLGLIAALAFAGCSEKSEAGAPATKSSTAAAKVSAASPLESRFTLSDAEPIDVDALFSLLPEKVRPTYDSAAFDEALGATVVTNLRFPNPNAKINVDDGENSVDAEIEIAEDAVIVERAEFYGVDMDAIDRVKAGEDAADAPFEEIFQKVRLFKIAPAGGDENTGATIGAAEFDRLRVRRGGVDDSGERANAAHFFNAFDLAGLYFTDFDFRAAPDGENSVAFSAPDLRLVGLGGGKLDAIIANGLRTKMNRSASAQDALTKSLGGVAGAIFGGPLSRYFAPSEQETVIETFEWRDVDFSGLMAYGLRNEKPPMTARDLIDLGTIKAANAESFIAGRRAARIDEMTASALEFTWLAPSKIRLDTKGGVYDFSAYIPPEEEETVALLKKHGLDKVAGDTNVTWDWDAAGGAAGLAAEYRMEGLADMTARLDLTELKLDKISALKEAGETDAVLKTGAFKGLNIVLDDEKLLDAVFDIAALQTGGAGADMRQSSQAIVRLSGAGAAAYNDRVKDYVNAVANFLSKGGTLEISAAPSSPVPLQAITATASPETLPDLINLTVTHKE